MAGSVGGQRFIERSGGGRQNTHIPHIDSAALGVREYIITVHTLLFSFNSISTSILQSVKVSAPAFTYH